ncbi:MAG TPA: CDP-alcohol phosphatidyltransferase family protein [Actinoplanes sp.]|nr:CDP-alcohol phosphatidyltransferase family protein [Actinoplanes sp.]
MRQSSTRARQALLVRVARRSGDAGRGATATRAEVLYTGADLAGPDLAGSEFPGTDFLGTDGGRRRGRLRGRAVRTGRPPAVGDGQRVPLLPGEQTAARKAGFALVNACTLASLSLGLLAIFLAMQGELRFAAACLVACVAFDGLDGALARKLGVSSPFGAQMDSLADMCSFGLAAPVVVYASLHGTVPTAAAAVTAALVAGCAAIRLARFNVSPKDGTFFCGVPTTMAAAVLALAVLIELPIPAGVLLGGVALLAVAMVSSFPYAKLAKLVKLPPWLWLLPIVGVLVDARLTFALVVFAYLASGPLLWLRLRRA